MSLATITQQKLFNNNDLDWTFSGEDTRQITHCYHDYPARMIPQIARQFFKLFAKKEFATVFDPYCGTGTSLVEGFIRGFDVIGSDLNPLARLITKSKVTLIRIKDLDEKINTFNREILQNPTVNFDTNISGVSRLDFWFKKDVVQKLSFIKNFIDEVSDCNIKLFFQVAFSETVREVSNTRTNEFKLYRYDEKTLENFQPDVFGIMSLKLSRNRKGFINFLSIIEKLPKIPQNDVYEINTVEYTPKPLIEKVDYVITSPPYGDSQTTVAYGQYSRLSAAWLDLNEPAKTDSKLMGSKRAKQVESFDCERLDYAIEKISQADKQRAKDVSSFYSDLRNSISNISKLLKKNGIACYVVGNRRVKSVCLPTDLAVQTFFEKSKFEHIKTFHREIPNKRMPLRNSPTNKIGKTEQTMNSEFIIVMQKL